MKKHLIFPILFLAAGFIDAQQSAVMDWAYFRSQVLLYHPLSRQAELYGEQSKAAWVRAKGAFDPKAYLDFSTKNYNEKNYFRHTEAGVKWPVGLGLEIKGNYNLARGNFLNPESAIPPAGQAAAGFSWTLGQGLVFDDRRAGLQQARIGLQQAEAERSLALNDLLFDAAVAYWNWVLAENQLGIFNDALLQAQIRHEALLESYRQGDKPAIDTLEAFIQLQNRRLDLRFAEAERQDAALEAGNFLWSPGELPLRPAAFPPPEQLTAGVFLPVEAPAGEEMLQTTFARHPALRSYALKMQELEIERRLKMEKRKPVFDLQYYLLGNGWQFFPTAGINGIGVLGNDIKWGLQFSYPVLNRKARGELQLTRIKIAQTGFSLQQKRLEIENKVRQYLNELNALSSQIATFRDISANYRRLLEAESEKFRFGESSVFLINTREQRWLEAQIKYLKLLCAYRKAEAGLLWATGAPAF